jgi:hypothetical protein
MQHIEVTAEKAVILSVVVFLASIQSFGDAFIDSLDYPNEIPMEGDFRITARLSGDVCGAQARFYIDQKFINSNALACGRKTTESDTISPSADGFACGAHTLAVLLSKEDDLLANYTTGVSFGNQPLIEVSEGSKGSREVTVDFKDNRTGNPVTYLKTRIYNVRKGTQSSEWHTTDSQGRIVYSSRDTGEYRLMIVDSDYCGEVFFYIKRPLYFEGPFPKDPIVGDLLSMAVPGGVSVKVYNSTGSLYLTGATSITGGVNYTISEPGNYTVVVGDKNSLYGTANVSIYVAAKASNSIEVAPVKALRGSPVALTLKADGVPLANATITVENPEGMLEDMSSGINGTIDYTPDQTGIYIVTFSDPKHLGAETRFEVRNSFLLDYTPKEPEVDADINVYARDHLNNLVPGATVSIKDVTYGLTGSDGKYTFRVSEPKKYTVLVTRSDYWDSAIEFTTISPLYLEIIPEEFELGETVRVRAFETRRNVVAADLVVISPDGSSSSFNGSFTPENVGAYEVFASKKGYISTSGNFSVKAHPLEMAIAIAGDRIIVNTTSHGLPAAKIPLVVEKTSGREKIVSDGQGHAVIRIKNDGRIKISANPEGENPDYGKITVVRNIVKMHDYSGLIMGLSAVALVALIAIAVVYAAPRWESGRPSGNVSRRVHARSGHIYQQGTQHSSLSGHKKGTSSLSRK